MMRLRTSHFTKLTNNNESVKQPGNIDYNQLNKSLEDKIDVKDFRKQTEKKDFHEIDEAENDISVIDKGSVIPIPGLIIPAENDESDWKAPTSDWIASHGPQWGPMNS